MSKPSLAIAHSMKKKKPFPKRANNKSSEHEVGVHKARLEMHEPGQSGAGYGVEAGDTKRAKEDHEVALAQLKSMPDPKLPMAEGGEVNPMREVTCPHCTKSFSHGGEVGKGEQSEAHEMDMISDLMNKRKMSKGGEVANTDLPVADFEPNEFDDLHLRDDLEEHYTAENSGDNISNPGEDKRQKDVVRMVMASRKKRPANASR